MKAHRFSATKGWQCSLCLDAHQCYCRLCPDVFETRLAACHSSPHGSYSSSGAADRDRCALGDGAQHRALLLKRSSRVDSGCLVTSDRQSSAVAATRGCVRSPGIVFGLDDTIERRRGDIINAKSIYRNPVRSLHTPFVKVSGLLALL